MPSHHPSTSITLLKTGRWIQQGIATACMRGVVDHLLHAGYVSVTLTDGSGLPDFYERFGFLPVEDAVARAWAHPDSERR